MRWRTGGSIVPIPEQLLSVAEDTRSGKRRWAKVKTLLAWFGWKGRGRLVVETIREALKELELDTEPDFTFGSVHTYVEFKPAPATEGGWRTTVPMWAAVAVRT